MRGARSRAHASPLPMPNPPFHRPRLVLAAIASGLCTTFAQTVPAPPSTVAKEEPIELSPFITTADSDKGYVATSSLAGSRVNTPLKDIAAQIDVMTPEFLAD